MENKILPNTTQIPHFIIRELMPRLKDVELRVLLVIADQTLGWIEDGVTGRRKEKDWISQYLLMKKTGRGKRSIVSATNTLVKEGIVEAYDEKGNLLDTPQARRLNFGKIYYRLNTCYGADTLFSKSSQSSRRVQILRTQKGNTTKETPSQNLAKASELDLEDKNQQEKKGLKADKTDGKLPTNELLGAFSRYCQAIRGVEPEFTRFKDGNLIKCALKYLTAGQIELLFIWFLKEKLLMRETIGAALCKEVVADFIKQSREEYGFYNRLEEAARVLTQKTEQDIKSEAGEMAERLARFKAEFFNMEKTRVPNGRVCGWSLSSER